VELNWLILLTFLEISQVVNVAGLRLESVNLVGVFKESEQDEPVQLHRELKARHISMIAIGGAIGTGWLVNGKDELDEYNVLRL
jgi:amino acid permease